MKKWKVGIYLRLSQEDRDKQNKMVNSESIKNQRNLLLQYIATHEDFTLVDEYCDEDLSGAGTYRPQFERLVKDCEKHKIDIVLCKSQSRFSRDMEIVEKYIHNKFREWNIRFIGVSDNADTENYGNKKSRQINGLVNEWFLEDVSNNIRSALKSKMKQGEFISPFASFGYEISKQDNNKLIIDPVASITVKEIYHLYLSGFGFSKIANDLNKKQIPSPSFYKYQKKSKLNIVSDKPRDKIKWSANEIKTILKNELYIGHLIQGKRSTISYKNHKVFQKEKENWIKVCDTHEAIIKEEDFLKVQIAMKERTRVSNTKGVIHPFSGKVYCLECQKIMRKKNSKLHEYLVCSNYECKNRKSIRYDELEKIILEKINEKISKYYDKTLLKQESKKSSTYNKVNILEKEKMELLKKKNNLKNYLKSLYEDKVNQIISTREFQELLTEYQKENSHFESEINLITKEIYQSKKKEKNQSNFLYHSKKLNTLNRVTIEEFIDKIFIGRITSNTREILIKWNL